MDRNTLNYVVDFGMAIAFLGVFTTGILRFPGFLQIFGLNSKILFGLPVSFVHDWSGLLMGLFVFLHLILHMQWIIASTKRLLIKKKAG